MSEYWKSLPRKQCEFCKCWITDNKPSIEFHERGKKHQENVQKKIAELRKKGQKDYEVKQSMEKDMKKMEAAALAAFKKDLDNNPELAERFKAETVPAPSVPAEPVNTVPMQEMIVVPPRRIYNVAPKPEKSPGKKRKTPPCSTGALRDKYHGTKVEIKVWFESITEEGHSYYWNVETGESTWEPPGEGYVSVLAQQKNAEGSAAEQQNGEDDKDQSEASASTNMPKYTGHEDTITSNVDLEPDEATVIVGPMARKDPYGQWVTVNTQSQPLDLGLPEKEKRDFKVPVVKEENKIKFKEKVVSSLPDNLYSSNKEIGFKKRKVNADFRRNIRRKDGDDDD